MNYSFIFRLFFFSIVAPSIYLLIHACIFSILCYLQYAASTRPLFAYLPSCYQYDVHIIITIYTLSSFFP